VDRGRVVAEPRWPQTAAAPASMTPATPQPRRPPRPPPTASRLDARIPPACAAAMPATPTSPVAAFSGRSRSAGLGDIGRADRPRLRLRPPGRRSRPFRATREATPISPSSRPRRTRAARRAPMEALGTFSATASPRASDEAWWLYGCLLEANGPTKGRQGRRSALLQAPRRRISQCSRLTRPRSASPILNDTTSRSGEYARSRPPRARRSGA
jgi:hypothetical protein